MSTCPECGSAESAIIDTHPGLRECTECGHPRESTVEELRAQLVALGYDPDGLAERLKKQAEEAVAKTAPVHFPLVWEDAGEWLRGHLEGGPQTTLFLIQRNPEKPDRGTMTGGVIPDDEDGKGTNENALLSWLQDCAAQMYLNDFRERLLAPR